MELISKNYFGLNGFLRCLHTCIQNASNQTMPLGERVQKESLPRIACAWGAYKALPQFALLGAGCQISLCLYKFSRRVLIPALWRTNEPLVEPLTECAEHFIRFSYNITILFFKKTSALAFLFPYEILALHEKFEGVLISKAPPSDETNGFMTVNLPEEPLIKKYARFVTRLIPTRLTNEDDLIILVRRHVTSYLATAQGVYQTASTAAAALLAGRRNNLPSEPQPPP